MESGVVYNGKKAKQMEPKGTTVITTSSTDLPLEIIVDDEDEFDSDEEVTTVILLFFFSVS